MVEFALLGLGAGAAYALLALGLVVVHRASGVLNFAVGAQAMIAAFLWQDFVSDGLPQAVAVILAVAISAVLGVLIHLVVMRPLSNSAPLVRITASLSLLLLFQTAAVMHWGPDSVRVRGFLPSDSVHVLGTDIGEDRVYVAAIALGLTVLFGVGYRFTLVGRATEAVASNPRLAGTLGWSPTFIGCANWAVGSALAGLAGILIVPITRLEVTSLTLLVIPALAVAMVAGFRSFTLTLVAGFALGIAQSEITGHYSFPSQQGLADAVPLVVVTIVLMITGRGIPQRDFAHDTLPAVGDGRIRPTTVVIGALAAIGLIGLGSTTLVDATTHSVTAAIVLVSVVVVTGYAGQLSLAQFAIAGVGAYASSGVVYQWGWPFEAAFVVGVLTAVVLGVVLGLPALRARGATLAVMTLGLGQALASVVFTNDFYTGNANGGGLPVGPQTLFGISIDPVSHNRRYAIVCVLVLAIVLLSASRLRRSRAGRRLLSVRENERASAALGINVTTAKLYAFAVGSAIAGAAGVLIAFTSYTTLFGAFDPFTSITFVMFAVLAGVGYLSGQPFIAAMAAAGSIAAMIFSDLDWNTNWISLVGAVLTILALISVPDGTAAEFARTIGSRINRPRKAIERPSVADATVPARAGATLELRGITVRFGGVVAVRDATVLARPGEVTGLIGPNGAGKTTMIDVASGFVRPSAGKVLLGGRDISGTSRHARARAGLSRSFQSLELFDALTVRENLLAASDDRDGLGYLAGLVRAGRDDLPPAAQAAADVFGLGPVLDRLPGDLPYGQRRLVAIARAAAASPAVLLLDEPAAGLGGEQTAELGELIVLLARKLGQTVLLVEHDLDLVVRISDRLIVMDRGAVLAEGTPHDVVRRPDVRAAYLGTDDEPAEPTDKSLAESANPSR